MPECIHDTLRVFGVLEVVTVVAQLRYCLRDVVGEPDVIGRTCKEGGAGELEVKNAPVRIALVRDDGLENEVWNIKS